MKLTKGRIRKLIKIHDQTVKACRSPSSRKRSASNFTRKTTKPSSSVLNKTMCKYNHASVK